MESDLFGAFVQFGSFFENFDDKITVAEISQSSLLALLTQPTALLAQIRSSSLVNLHV